MSKSAKLEPGTIVAGRYRVEREIGRGGMAQVYEARHTDIGKAVAVKVLASEFISSPVVVERFLREARAAAAVRSPYICDVHDSGKLDDGRPFLVMELLEGESLYERMVKIRQFDAPTTARVISQVARGLTKAHAAGIVHRDLKPENIFLTTNEEGELLSKVLDFGLAKFYTATDDGGAQARLTREGAIFGTPAYMSPEQVQGQGTVDHRADLWALGCIAYECLTGRTVWSTDKGIAMTFAQIASAPLPKLSRYRPDLPATLDAWFTKALAREADDRYQTARDLADALTSALEVGPPSLLFTSEASRAEKLPITSDLIQQFTGQPLAPEPSPQPAPPDPNTPPSALPETQPSPDQRQESIINDGSSSSVKQASAKPKPGPRPWLWPAVVVGTVCLAGGGVAAWQIAQPRPTPATSAPALSAPPPPPTASSSAPAVASSASPAASAGEPPPTPGPRWQALVAEGQARLLAGELDEAAKRFKEAQDSMGSPVGKAMLDHVQAARESKGSCKLAALSRVRPFSVSSQSTGRPTLLKTDKGLLVLWADDHESVTHEHVYVQLLDARTLRPEGGIVDVTPEADKVGQFAVSIAGDKLALLYSNRSTNPGLFLRWLSLDGRVTAAPTQVAGPKAAQSSPSIAVEGEALWGAWEERGDADKFDLAIAKLGPGAPSPSVRLTDFRKGRFKPRVVAPQIAVRGGTIEVIFRTDRDNAKPIQLIQIATTDPALASGLAAATPKQQKEDRALGQFSTLSALKDKGDTPSLVCTQDECVATWHIDIARNQAGFAIIAINPRKGDIPWSKRFSFPGTGGRPSMGINDKNELLASWYDNNRILAAPFSAREGLGSRSHLAHVAGDRPPPSIVGLSPKEWAIGWLDFEKGRLEPYVLRATCP